MSNNFIAGLASVSTAWTHQNPPGRRASQVSNAGSHHLMPNRTSYSRPRAQRNDLDVLIQSSQAALQRIEDEYPQLPAPAYDSRRPSYDCGGDFESVISPLSTPTGSIRSGHWRSSLGMVDGREGPRDDAAISERSWSTRLGIHAPSVRALDGGTPDAPVTVESGQRPTIRVRAPTGDPSATEDLGQDERDAIEPIAGSSTGQGQGRPSSQAFLGFADVTLVDLQDSLYCPPPADRISEDRPSDNAETESRTTGERSRPGLSRHGRTPSKSSLRWVRNSMHNARAKMSKTSLAAETVPKTVPEKPPGWSKHDPYARHPVTMVGQPRDAPQEEAAVPLPEEEEVKEEEQEEDTSAYISGFKLAVVVLALSSAVFTVAMDINIIATAIPKITGEFGSLKDVGWYGSAYLLTTCAFQILFGRIYTFFPTKWVFVSAILVFELGSLAAGVAKSSPVFIFGRAVQGIGTSGIISGALIVISRIVPLQKRSILGGMVGSMEGIAMIAAPLIGGALTDHASWRWCFYINLPIGAFVITVVVFYLSIPPPNRNARSAPLWEKLKQLDLVGATLLLLAIVTLLLALQWGGTKYDWDSLGIITLFLLAFVLIGQFTYFQWSKGNKATIPPRIIKQRSILAGFVFSLCTSAGLVVTTYYLPLWFQAIKNASANKSGILILPLLISVIISVVGSGALVSAIGYFTPFMIVGSVFMSLGAGLLSTFSVDTSTAKQIIFPALFGIGVGCGFQQPLIAAQTVLAGEDIPIGTSVMVFGQTFGGAIILSVAQSVFSNGVVANIKRLNIPGLDVNALLDAGATSIANSANLGIPQEFSRRLLVAYSSAITRTFSVAVTVATVSIIGALAMEWKSVKAKRKPDA